MHHLIIMSAGKNSRFNSEEKILASINGLSNIQNTYDKAKSHFSSIWLAIDPRWFKRYSGIPDGVGIIETIGGKGDIHSIYHAMKKLPGMKSDDLAGICWGDAVFLSDAPFLEFKRLCSSSPECNAFVAVSKDRYPYAWFDVDNDVVKKAYFRKDYGDIPAGIHDQSLFAFRMKAMDSIEEYFSVPSTGEWKTLNYLEWLYSSRWNSARCRFISRGNVKSFNTKDELKRIRECLG